MDGSYIVYGSPGPGSVPVEAALTLIGALTRQALLYGPSFRYSTFFTGDKL